MKKLLKKYLNDDSGATAIEYGLIAGLIAAAMILGATALGQSTSTLYEDAANSF